MTNWLQTIIPSLLALGGYLWSFLLRGRLKTLESRKAESSENSTQDVLRAWNVMIIQLGINRRDFGVAVDSFLDTCLSSGNFSEKDLETYREAARRLKSREKEN